MIPELPGCAVCPDPAEKFSGICSEAEIDQKIDQYLQKKKGL